MLEPRSGHDQGDVQLFRRRVDQLREEYLRTHRLLQEEGKRLSGFLQRASLRPYGKHPDDSGDLTEDQRLIAGLTVRERQTLQCIAEGCSTKETAARLDIRFKTAACHRYRIMQKLGVHDTTALVRIALRCGIVRL